MIDLRSIPVEKYTPKLEWNLIPRHLALVNSQRIYSLRAELRKEHAQKRKLSHYLVTN